MNVNQEVIIKLIEDVLASTKSYNTEALKKIFINLVEDKDILVDPFFKEQILSEIKSWFYNNNCNKYKSLSIILLNDPNRVGKFCSLAIKHKFIQLSSIPSDSQNIFSRLTIPAISYILSHLSITDIARVAGVNKILYNAATHQKTIESVSSVDTCGHKINHIVLKKYKHVKKWNLGYLCSEIDIMKIIDYCEDIRDITTHNISEITLIHLVRKHPKLEKLQVYCEFKSTDRGSKEIFSHCGNLTYLHFTNNNVGCTDLIAKYCKNLEIINYNGNLSSICELLQNCPKLFHVSGCLIGGLYIKEIEDILNNYPRLEHLDLNCIRMGGSYYTYSDHDRDIILLKKLRENNPKFYYWY